MIWWRWGGWGWGSPGVSLHSGHLQSFSSSWEPPSLWGLILIAEAKWLWYSQNWVRTSGSSGFNASFSDGLGNQPLPFPQAYCLALSWACLPTQLMVSDMCECGILWLAQAKSLLLEITLHRKGQPNLGLSPPLLWGRFAISEHVLQPQVLARYVGVMVCSSVCSRDKWISRQYQVSGWSGICFLMGDWDDEQDKTLPNASISLGPLWPFGGVRVWPSFWMITPDLDHPGHLIRWPLTQKC